jgi:hypothetical protein
MPLLTGDFGQGSCRSSCYLLRNVSRILDTINVVLDFAAQFRGMVLHDGQNSSAAESLLN